MSDLSTEFDVMFERSRPRLKRFVDLLLRDTDSADDVMQETYLRASSGFSSLQKPEAFTSWLFRIARNLAYAELNRVKKGVSIDLVDEPELSVDDTESPQQLLGRREVGILLSRAVAELPPQYQEVIALREYEGLSYAEIADVTGSTIDAVKSRLFKARKSLFKRLRRFFQ